MNYKTAILLEECLKKTKSTSGEEIFNAFSKSLEKPLDFSEAIEAKNVINKQILAGFPVRTLITVEKGVN